jgi:hypothetical protein
MQWLAWLKGIEAPPLIVRSVQKANDTWARLIEP